MKRPVYYSAEFIQALRRNLKYLRERDKSAWTDILEVDLMELEFLMVDYPTAGKRMSCRGTVELRKLRLKRTPFVVWYIVDSKNTKGPIIFLRLFHVRQRSSIPRF